MNSSKTSLREEVQPMIQDSNAKKKKNNRFKLYIRVFLNLLLIKENVITNSKDTKWEKIHHINR